MSLLLNDSGADGVIEQWSWIDLHILPLPLTLICTALASVKCLVQFCYVQVAEKHKVQIEELLKEKSDLVLPPLLA
jgi:hypothetical protein